MGYIIIKQVKYVGDKYIYESPILKPGLNILEGKNGTGKTTFMNIIYYGLSGSVEEFHKRSQTTHREIIEDTNNYVELYIEINGSNFQFLRYINSNEITVFGPDGEVNIFAINRSNSEQVTFSDWMLSELNIDVVEVYQGDRNWKINITDLFRLIYHDQELSPRKIYKKPDTQNFITDSEMLRKVIFQLLIGKTFSEYYSVLSEFKKVEKERLVARNVLDQFLTISQTIEVNVDNFNLIFLSEKRQTIVQRLDVLIRSRDHLKNNRPKSIESLSEVSELKAVLLENEIKVNDLLTQERALLDENVKLQRLKEHVILEVLELKKIIHTHEELNLFSPDTCPYCLRKVEREKGHCICGSEIDESQFERFFYSRSEYLEILKSKQKSIGTIDLAIYATSNDYHAIKESLKEIVLSNDEIKRKIYNIVIEVDNNIDVNALNNIDDKIFEAKDELFKIDQQIEMEEKRDKLQNELDNINTRYELLKVKTKELEAQADSELISKIAAFNTRFNILMKNTLSECRSARISTEDYMPIINEGDYREASSTVPIRLMYYFTLLKMSLDLDDVKFPKLLLVDTPETAGIDLDNLLKSYEQISYLKPQTNNIKYQIILTTGEKKYPDQFNGNVFSTLYINDRLLQEITL